VEQSSSADRWVIWDKPKERFFHEHQDMPRLFIRRLDAVREMRRDIKDHNARIKYAKMSGRTESSSMWDTPFRDITEEDYDIIPCKVEVILERT